MPNSANAFNEHFVSKIALLRSSIKRSSSTCSVSDPLQFDSTFSGSPLCQFSPATTDEIRVVIQRSTSTTSNSDPLPTFILKQCLTETIGIIIDIINLSMNGGHVPNSLREALVTPLLKNGKPPNELSSYRPIAQLHSYPEPSKGWLRIESMHIYSNMIYWIFINLLTDSSTREKQL